MPRADRCRTEIDTDQVAGLARSTGKRAALGDLFMAIMDVRIPTSSSTQIQEGGLSVINIPTIPIDGCVHPDISSVCEV
jgi:hypothetical protein